MTAGTANFYIKPQDGWVQVAGDGSTTYGFISVSSVPCTHPFYIFGDPAITPTVTTLGMLIDGGSCIINASNDANKYWVRVVNPVSGSIKGDGSLRIDTEAYLGGSSPPVGVSLSGVSFIPSAHAVSTQLGWTDTSYLVMSMWVRGFMGTGTRPASQPWSWAVRDIVCSVNETTTAWGSENIPGYDICNDNAAGSYGTLRSNINANWPPAANNNNAAINTNTTTTSGQPGFNIFQTFNGIWTHFLQVMDTSDPTNPRNSFAINGVPLVTTTAIPGSTLPSALIPYIGQNTRGLGIANNSGNGPFGCTQFDMAQLFMDCGSDLPSNPFGWLDVSGSIPTALIQQFYKTGPVDFGSDGSAVLGLSRKPGLYLNGNKSSFLTNKGSSTATWSMTPSSFAFASAPMTATPTLYDSPVGPGQSAPLYPYLKWQAQGGSNASSGMPSWQELTSTIQNKCTVTNYCQPIAAGDRILVLLATTDNNGGINHAIQTPSSGTPTTGWTWTAVSGFPAFLPTNGPGYGMNIAAFSTVAPADLTANSEISFPINFTANSQLVGMRWVMLNLGKNASTLVGACDATVLTARTAITTPTVTVTSASVATPAMCLDMAIIWQPPPTLPEATIPTGSRKIAGAFLGEPTRYTDVTIAARSITATGTTTSKTITQEQNIPAMGATIVIQP